MPRGGRRVLRSIVLWISCWAASGAGLLFGAIGVSALLEVFKNSRGIEIIRYSAEKAWTFGRSVITYGNTDSPAQSVAHQGGLVLATPAASPALIAVGYIIGPRLAAVTFAGGAFAWLFLVPVFLLSGEDC